MSMQETPSGRSPPRFGGRKGQASPPACPTCQRHMTVKQVLSVLFASGLDDVIFTCDKCKTETKRTLKRT